MLDGGLMCGTRLFGLTMEWDGSEIVYSIASWTVAGSKTEQPSRWILLDASRSFLLGQQGDLPD